MKGATMNKQITSKAANSFSIILLQWFLIFIVLCPSENSKIKNQQKLSTFGVFIT
jgi:hypothetical protein